MSDTIHLSGDFYIETFTNGVSGGIIGPIDVDSLEVKPDSNKVSIPSKRRNQYGQARETYYTSKPPIVTIKTSEIPPVLLAAAFMAEAVDINQGSGAITDVNVVLPAHPKWASLGKTNIAATGLAVKEGSTSLTLGTDFEINYALGLIRAKSGGAVADGGTLTVSATYNAVTGTSYNGNIKPEVKARLLLDGESVIDGKKTLFKSPMASLAPKNAVDFMSDKPIEVTLEGEMLIIEGETAPFYVDQPKTVV